MGVVVTMIMIKIGENYVILPGHKVETKNPEKSRKNFLPIPGLKIRVNPVPKNPGIPGFGKIPGLKILIPLGPVRTT